MIERLSAREVSDHTKKLISDRMKNAERLTCPHCGVTGDPLNMKKYHFDKCKSLTGVEKHEIKQLTDIVTCPHCGLEGKEQGMRATHFDQCYVVRGNFRKMTKNITCPHCGSIGADCHGFYDYHFDNCKVLTGVTIRTYDYDLTEVECPHCGKVGKRHGMLSAHFEHCPSLKPVKPKITCPHCGKEGNDNGYFKSHHFEKCKCKPS